MLIGKIEVKRRVWIGLAFALAVTGAWLMWTRAKPPVVAAVPPGPAPFVRLTGAGTGAGDRVLRERAELFDPTPLFFPTEWNFGQRPLPESMQRQPGQVFENFGANFTFGEQDIKAYGAEAAAAPERLEDVLEQGNEAPFGGIGQIDSPRVPLPERSSFLEVKELSDGKIIISQALKELILPRSDFAPMEFLVVVSSAGIVGEPVLMTGSRWEEVDEEVDAFFRSYLVKTFRLGERLSPGRYRVLVGP
jgi:hypothetical protein